MTDLQIHVLDLPDTDWAQSYERCCSFAEGRQHDVDAQGNPAPSANYLMQRYRRDHLESLIENQDGAMSRPTFRTPVAKGIVGTFTGMLLGEPPQVLVAADLDRQHFLQCLYEYGQFQAAMMHARNLAGAGSAVVVVAEVIAGRPALRVLRPSQCLVLEWSSTERVPPQPQKLLWQALKVEFGLGADGKVERKERWHTIVWTETETIVYEPVPKDYDRKRPIPISARTPHHCDRCPATWWPNGRVEADCPWGISDIDQCESLCDAADEVGSLSIEAVANNVDPSILHKDDQMSRRQNPVESKGRGVVWKASPAEEIKYVEINGNSVKLGTDTHQRLIDLAYESAECIRVTPETAGNYRSGIAFELLWRRPKIKVRQLWPACAATHVRVFECYLAMAAKVGIGVLGGGVAGGIMLPGKVLQEDTSEGPGKPNVNNSKIVPHSIGKGGTIQVLQGPIFAPTQDDQAKEITTLQGASGGGKVLSRRTVVERVAAIVGRNPQAEWERIEAEQEQELDAFDPESAEDAEEAKGEADEDRKDAEEGEPEDADESGEGGEDEGSGDEED